MGWPVTDFDNVRFNQDNTGWNEVAAIHLALKERQEAISPIATTILANPFSGNVWLGDPDGDVNRVYLKDIFTQYYDYLVELLGDADWSNTLGGTAWTEASLVSDIGMGDFADLLTRAQDFRPFKWFHEAFDRMIYVHVEVEDENSFSAASQLRQELNGSSLQDAWTKAKAKTPSANIFPGSTWSTTGSTPGSISAAIRDNGKCRFDMSGYTGSIESGEFFITRDRFKLSINVNWTVGPVSGTATSGSTNETTWESWTTTYATGGNVDVSAVFDTAVPSTIPFTGSGGNISLYASQARFNIDLTGVLTDQA